MTLDMASSDEKMPPMLLHVVPSEGSPFDHALEGETFVLGRSSKADLTVADRSMSRMHARLYRDQGGWFVEDLGSRNGTLLGGRRVDDPVRLSHGSMIQVGSTSITLREATRPQRSRSQPVQTPSSHTIFRSAAELLQEPEVIRSDTATPVGEGLRQYVDRLHLVQEVLLALDGTMTLEELLELILDRAFEHLGPEEAAIYLHNREGAFECAASRSIGNSDPQTLFSTSLIHQVVDEGQAALILDVEADENFNEAMSLLDAGVRSLVAAPLLDPDGALGMIVLGSRLNIRQFSEEDMELLASLASVAAMRIRNVHLAKEREERRRLERDVALAREIQVSLLPARLPEVEGWGLAAGNIPSRGVSGDFYKVEITEDGSQCYLMLADVSGKGIAASLLTASLEALAAGPIHDGVPPEMICSSVSHLLFERTPPEKYATSFLALVNPETGVLRYCNAGHNPGLVLRCGGEAEWLESTGMPLGIMPTGTFTAGEITLEAGDTLVLYTDGITEAENPEEDEYGPERLRESCLRNLSEPLEEVLAAIEEDLYHFVRGVPFLDDRTLVLLRRLD